MVKFDRNGLVPAIVQDSKSGQVLMVAYMNRPALEVTLKTGKTHFYSRSRKRIWLKGETSGHFQQVKQIALDCDGDALLIRVRPKGGACHEGYQSCFFRRLNGSRGKWQVVGKRVFNPKRVYGRSV